MASLNLSINGPSIKSSYQGVINGPAPSSASPTYAHWALFSVQAPLLNAFQDSGAKESILKVESTGDGELSDLIEDFNEGRIQFAFVKVKDPNSGLPKNVLIAWCGGGVPERTKGYFTSHLAAVSKILHGYHVQITARSDGDLSPESIVQKVADASGAKYTAGGSAPVSAAAPPPVAKKPVFTPTASTSAGSFNPIIAARTRNRGGEDDDGWGADAPPVTRSQLEKVASAYQPTKVNIAELRKNKDDSRSDGTQKQDDRPDDIVKGGYQPIGKIDIAALRAQAKKTQDDRPATVKGAYEPVGKVDIAAIRAKAQQRPAEPEESETPKSLAERTAAFTQAERLTELPKPKVAKKFVGSAAFTGTKAPTPAPLGFGSPAVPAVTPIASASRTFADQGGKTPAQIWAEKKAKQGGAVAPVSTPSPAAAPIAAQKSGSEWKSGYAGKSWAVQAPNYSRGVETHATGGSASQEKWEPEAPASPAGGISALRDRFKDTAPVAVNTGSRSAPSVPSPGPATGEEEHAPPPLPTGSRPSGGFALPGLPSRPPVADAEEENDERQLEEEVRAQDEEEPSSPVRIAVPVARSAVPEMEPAGNLPPRPVPVPQELPREEDLPVEEDTHDPRAAALNVASESLGHDVEAQQAGSDGGKRALVQYDYEKAEDNEIDLREGEYVTNIQMVDDDWWMGTNAQGESGLFPSNYVEVVEDDEPAAASSAAPTAAVTQAPAVPSPAQAEAVAPATPAGQVAGPTATAQFDYEAAEDNELSFPEGATITGLEFPDDDWWFGHYNGASGLFPANYVELDA
ncbi:hypothetical protein B0H65DRAFT_331570 [Neurospora tetraspora]|uniref:Actin binding protein n=1 Tax=Neurospora tetraspora TaxID=94610 RepID=A0AAE0J156_9PEZI|nr:hypothetical protein B0H65DRAFT_331570 [Neurospora tetraspora]